MPTPPTIVVPDVIVVCAAASMLLFILKTILEVVDSFRRVAGKNGNWTSDGRAPLSEERGEELSNKIIESINAPVNRLADVMGDVVTRLEKIYEHSVRAEARDETKPRRR